MRTILITLILVGLMEGLSGFGLDTGLRGEDEMTAESIALKESPEPQFANLNGSLFLALKTNQSLKLDEGSVVEFIFKRQSMKSFHVNDANQDILNHDGADVLVMIHHDLAMALKTEKLMTIKITSNGEVSSFEVGDFWAPHRYLSNR